ncbi:MAG: hypothetical protein RIT43_1649 [Bacteroidota bacterium]|jgi:hypothetical protein
MKNTNKKYLATIEVPEDQRNNPEVLRIILSDEYTQIDFGYVAEWIYEKGGWIRIAPHTFIQAHGSEKRYAMKEAINITIAPEQHHFESTEDWQVFTLIFEPIPIKECVIDIIEEVSPDENDFNFYGVKLKEVEAIGLIER